MSHSNDVHNVANKEGEGAGSGHVQLLPQRRIGQTSGSGSDPVATLHIGAETLRYHLADEFQR